MSDESCTIPPAPAAPEEQAMTSTASAHAPRKTHRITQMWPHVLLACGCAISITLLATSYVQSSLGVEAVGALRNQAARIDRLDRLQMQLVDAETGVRGYLLTSEALYLEPYEAAAAALPETIRALRADFAPLPEEQSRLLKLVDLVDRKREVLGLAIAARTLDQDVEGEFEGKLLMDEARDLVGVLRANLVAYGERNIDQSLRNFRQTRVAGILLASGSLVLLLLLFAVLQRQFELRERIAGLLAGENQRLDREVRARTIELSSLASYLTNAREAEQAHLARELHDELGALLTAAKLDADWIARKLPQEVREHLDTRISRLQHTLSEGIALKRRIIDDLRPPLLKDLGLIAALKALLEDFAIDGEPIVHTDLPDENTPGLPPEQSLALFRIAQESLTNIRKYAAAKNVWVSLRLDAGVAHLEVRDDGCGFSGAALPAASRHGLAGMKHRVQSHAGEFELQTAPGQGTRISARIPLDPPQRDATAA